MGEFVANYTCKLAGKLSNRQVGSSSKFGTINASFLF